MLTSSRRSLRISHIITTMSIETINSLPVEILIDILKLTLPRPKVDDATVLSRDTLDTIHPRNFLAVCRHWRHVVKTTPSLWTNYAISLERSGKIAAQTANRLLRQVLDLSGDLPLSFYLYSDQHMDSKFQSTMSLSQRKWEKAAVAIYLTSPGSESAFDVAALVSSPIRELNIRGCNVAPSGLTGSLVLLKLSILILEHCNPSFFSLLPLAPNLELLDISMSSYTFSGTRPEIPPLYFQRLRMLWIDDSRVLEKLSCPGLQHLRSQHLHVHALTRFIQRNSVRLLSLRVRAKHAHDTIPIIRTLPSLISLDIRAASHDSFFIAMVETDPTSGRFALCPLLQDIALGDGKGFNASDQALKQFIDSRWRTPPRTIKRIRVRHRRLVLEGEQWEALRKFKEEGLDV